MKNLLLRNSSYLLSALWRIKPSVIRVKLSLLRIQTYLNTSQCVSGLSANLSIRQAEVHNVKRSNSSLGWVEISVTKKRGGGQQRQPATKTASGIRGFRSCLTVTKQHLYERHLCSLKQNLISLKLLLATELIPSVSIVGLIKPDHLKIPWICWTCFVIQAPDVLQQYTIWEKPFKPLPADPQNRKMTLKISIMWTRHAWEE